MSDGKKQRKHGRNRVRGQAKRYLAENREARNKRRRMARHAKAVAYKEQHHMKVPHGTARAKRRAKLRELRGWQATAILACRLSQSND